MSETFIIFQSYCSIFNANPGLLICICILVFFLLLPQLSHLLSNFAFRIVSVSKTWRPPPARMSVLTGIFIIILAYIGVCIKGGGFRALLSSLIGLVLLVFGINPEPIEDPKTVYDRFINMLTYVHATLAAILFTTLYICATIGQIFNATLVTPGWLMWSVLTVVFIGLWFVYVMKIVENYQNKTKNSSWTPIVSLCEIILCGTFAIWCAFLNPVT